MIPKWLNKDKEIKNSIQKEEFRILKKEEKAIVFILFALKQINEINLEKKYNLKPQQILSILANSISEVGWNFEYNGNNLGGWKIREEYCIKYKNKFGIDPEWFQKKGHINSGDQEIVFYIGFPTIKKFFEEWIEKYTPKQSTTDNRYFETGINFWDLNNWKPENWFSELIKAGYKGEVTKNNPNKSINNFIELNDKIGKIFCQYMLNVKTDGDWGNKTIEASKKINQHGNYDIELFNKLFYTWEKQGMKLILEL